MPKVNVIKVALAMDTIIQIKTASSTNTQAELEEKVDQALNIFYQVEHICSRFNPQSELMQLVHKVGEAVPVSPILFEITQFAVQIAERTDGVFDPTVGKTLEDIGFNREYASRKKHSTAIIKRSDVSHKDIYCDRTHHTITLKKPLVLDFGAIAKGAAIDLAARELEDIEGFVIDAGGDLYVKGLNEKGEHWEIGIRHPLEKDKIIAKIKGTNVSICTSGSYERYKENRANHHLIHAKTGNAQNEIISCTAIAPYAMLADAFSTSAFLLGPVKGIAFLEEEGVEGILISPELTMHTTKGIGGFSIEYL
ncbi:FAD:protein FMN transferase [Bacillus sp. 03113]|uniref:FAD:protein FMN transferase n=1 Tax=Bacillus sp. 03113 TaxID=2578211 RepID=UPI0011430639|nr:FAD:protein FMN transferase [Bacillus sp. 03113]